MVAVGGREIFRWILQILLEHPEGRTIDELVQMRLHSMADNVTSQLPGVGPADVTALIGAALDDLRERDLVGPTLPGIFARLLSPNSRFGVDTPIKWRSRLTIPDPEMLQVPRPMEQDERGDTERRSDGGAIAGQDGGGGAAGGGEGPPPGAEGGPPTEGSGIQEVLRHGVLFCVSEDDFDDAIRRALESSE